jgi:hypothetical protein
MYPLPSFLSNESWLRQFMSGSQLRVSLLRFTLGVSFGFIVLLVMGFIFFPSGDESVDDPIGWANRLQTYSLCFSLALIIRVV